MAFDIFAGSRSSLERDGADAGRSAKCADARIASTGDAVGKAVFAVLDNLEADILDCLRDRALQPVTCQFAPDFFQGGPDNFLQEPGMFGNAKIRSNRFRFAPGLVGTFGITLIFNRQPNLVFPVIHLPNIIQDGEESTGNYTVN